MDILARVEFLKVPNPDYTGIYINGIRPTIEYVNGSRWDCAVGLDSEAFPGDVVEATISFLSPNEHDGAITEGMKFKLYSVNDLIGLGEFIIVSK